MPAPRPTSTRTSPPRSDENLVVTAIAAFLVAALVLGTVAYRYFKHSQQQQEQIRSERQTYQRYNDYLKSAEEMAPAPQARPSAAAQTNAAPAQPSMAEKLLSHPAVTPGPGFNAAGVQQTGVAIIEAMDHAQAMAKQ